MILADVNALIYAFWPRTPLHTLARDVLTAYRERGELIVLTEVAASFMRIVTDARVSVEPDSPEAAISFVDFVEKYENVISAEDVLSGKVADAKLKALRASDISALIEKLGTHCKDHEWTKKQVDHLVAWVKALPGEQQTSIYYAILGSKNLNNIKAFHAPIGRQIVDTINAARSKSGK